MRLVEANDSCFLFVFPFLPNSHRSVSQHFFLSFIPALDILFITSSYFQEQSRVTRSPSQTGSPHFGLEYDDTILSRKMGSPLDPAMTNGIPPATLDLSVIAPAAHELSTLV